jgi:hypothetical protein
MPSLLVRDAAGKLHSTLGKPGEPPFILAFVPGRGSCSLYQGQLDACEQLAERYGHRLYVIIETAPNNLLEIGRQYDVDGSLYSDELGKTRAAFGPFADAFVAYVIDKEKRVAFRNYAPVDPSPGPLVRYLDWAAARGDGRS